MATTIRNPLFYSFFYLPSKIWVKEEGVYTLVTVIKPTPVQVAAYLCHSKVLIGGHPEGVRFLLSNKAHYGITQGFILHGMPALNTEHFRSLFSSGKHCHIYPWSSIVATEACYSLFETVKNVVYSFNIFCVGGPSYELVSDWSRSTNEWVIFMLSHICTAHWWIWSDDSDEIVFFSKNTESSLRVTYEFTNESYRNDSTYENESSISWVRLIKDELLTGATYAINIKAMQYIFHWF